MYRGRLRGVDVAIKVLDATSQQGQQEFSKEVQVLGALHHPHLLPLMGSCPEKHALVYPFMPGGSLQQRLEASTPTGSTLLPPGAGSSGAAVAPLLWFDRVRICHETVLALVWLHGHQPSPILHMDLKPDNVLLDR